MKATLPGSSRHHSEDRSGLPAYCRCECAENRVQPDVGRHLAWWWCAVV